MPIVTKRGVLYLLSSDLNVHDIPKWDVSKNRAVRSPDAAEETYALTKR